MYPIHQYVIIRNSSDIVFFEDNIEQVKEGLEYLTLNRPGNAYAVYKLINVSLELEKED